MSDLGCRLGFNIWVPDLGARFRGRFGFEIWVPDLGARYACSFLVQDLGTQIRRPTQAFTGGTHNVMWHPNLHPNLHPSLHPDLAPKSAPKSVTQIWNPNLHPKSDTNHIWHQNLDNSGTEVRHASLAPKYGTKWWNQNLAPKSGTQIIPNLPPKSGAKIWHQNLAHKFNQILYQNMSSKTVLQTTAHKLYIFQFACVSCLDCTK